MLRESNLRFTIIKRNVSIGRKYRSADEIGIPFFITVDKTSTKDGCVTLRHRNSADQIRIKVAAIRQIVEELVSGEIGWNRMRQI
ncbi:SYG [Enterospora canceri]|nr:SYG [Enterospora canceri]